jgi:type I restriction enzyme R subunit
VLEQGFAGPNGIRHAPHLEKTVVFAVTKRHAETLARMLDQGIRRQKADRTRWPV